MRLRSIHPVVQLNPALGPPVTFKPAAPGVYEADVPDAVGRFLLMVSKPGEYIEVPGATPAEAKIEPSPRRQLAEAEDLVEKVSAENMIGDTPEPDPDDAEYEPDDETDDEADDAAEADEEPESIAPDAPKTSPKKKRKGKKGRR